jgi:hypothetical protein
MIDVPQGIPSQIIDLAEKNVEQARGAFLGFIGAAQKATDAAETLPSSTKDAIAKATSFAESNVNAVFDLAQKLVRTKDVNEILALQSEFAKSRWEGGAAGLSAGRGSGIAKSPRRTQHRFA